jgi:hypothetical protein
MEEFKPKSEVTWAKVVKSAIPATMPISSVVIILAIKAKPTMAIKLEKMLPRVK